MLSVHTARRGRRTRMTSVDAATNVQDDAEMKV
jgi:hypothetical protein